MADELTTLDESQIKNKSYTVHGLQVMLNRDLAELYGVTIFNLNKAVEINIQIIRAFVSMKKFIASNAQIFHRLDTIERKQLIYEIKTDKQLEQIFAAIESKDIKAERGVFFKGDNFLAFYCNNSIFQKRAK